jgi:ubiquinone/menaquinone biosynthesis C-methylase UbiE
VTRVSARWEDPRTVAGFVSGAPNAQLLAFARTMRETAAPRGRPAHCVDIGCGAARNAIALARLGFHVSGTDLSEPMLDAARTRAAVEAPGAPMQFALAPMTALPFVDRTFDLIVAHGIWNLARSGAEFRAAVAEAARVARPAAGLFLFTFSRHTLPADARPDPGESFVFSSWNGEPQCFLTEEQIREELASAGFVPDRADAFTEYNRPAPGQVSAGGPVIYEATFIRQSLPGPRREQP